MSMIVTPTFSHLDEFWRLAVNWLLLFKALKLSFEVGICDIDAHGEHTITLQWLLRLLVATTTQER